MRLAIYCPKPVQRQNEQTRCVQGHQVHNLDILNPDSMKSNFFNLSSRCLLPLQPNPTPCNPAPSPSLTHPGRSHFFFLDHFRQISFTPACSLSFPVRICSIWSRDIRTKGFQCCWLDRSRNRCHCLEYMRRCCGVIHTGKRPRLAHASMI